MALTLHGTVSDNTVALDRKTATPLIINGDMAISQRGTSATSVSSSQYLVDRHKAVVGAGANSVFTISQNTDVPTGQGFSKSFKMDVTTAESSLASGSAVFLLHRIEGQNLQMFKKGTSNAETFTISFWVKSAKTGVHILQLRDNDNTRQQAQSYTIASANTWEKHVVNFVADTTGAFDNDNQASLDLMWWLSAGSDYTSGTLSTSWESVTNANRAVGQVNLADSTSNDWYITGVQLEVGTFDANSIPPFQFEDRATSLARCQRYCYQEDNSDSYHGQLSGFYTSTTLFIGVLALPVAMRSSPSITTSGNFQTAGGPSGSRDCSNIVLSDSTGTNINQVQVRATVSGATSGDGTFVRNKNDVNAIFRLESEL